MTLFVRFVVKMPDDYIDFGHVVIFNDGSCSGFGTGFDIHDVIFLRRKMLNKDNGWWPSAQDKLALLKSSVIWDSEEDSVGLEDFLLSYKGE